MPDRDPIAQLRAPQKQQGKTLQKVTMLSFDAKPTTLGGHDATQVAFTIGGDGSLDPSALTTMDPPAVDGSKGVVLWGRGPVWLYSALIHHYHATRWVGTFDPRLGVVVVSRHHGSAPAVGSVLN